METPSSRAGQEEKPRSAVPTAVDIENARARQEIAARMEAEYLECLAWAEQAFGRGYEPSCRHTLTDKQEESACRQSGARPRVAAAVYTVKNASGERRHFTVGPDGQVVECASYQAGFGDMLLELHPTLRIELRGELVAPHRYSLCWAGYELYTPKSTDQLAALREERVRRREEREDRKWAEENPLLAWAGIKRQDA